VAYTAAISDRSPIFSSSEVVAEQVAILDESRLRYGCLVMAYTFMPDHVHVFMRGESEDSDPLAAFEKYKQKSGFALSRRGLPKWQPSFYDHIVRHGEDWQGQIRYILRNPVRACLVEDWSDWPHCGSLGVDIREVVSEL